MAQTNYTPISLYYSTTASAVPTAANLVPGELAINTNDGKLYYEDSSGVVQVLATKSTGSIGGSNTQVQFNNSGSLGGSSSFTWDGTTVTATKFAGALNGTVGATTASTGAFTTLTSNGATTFTAGTASTSTTTGTTVITGGLGVSGRINAANFDGIVGANTAAAGSFTTLSATGVATFSAGTVSLPAITTTSDTNTGIYFPAADTIAFTEGGAESMRIDSSGNVGIGTSSPQKRLQSLASGTGLFEVLRVSNNQARGANVGVKIGFQPNVDYVNGSLIGASISATNTSGSDQNLIDLVFGTGGGGSESERMRIDSSGNVLVGKTSATANGGDLQVSSGITFPATQVAKSDANTLDDYEEGTWTPSVGGTATYGSNQFGYYTKVGNIVTCQFAIEIATLGTGSTSLLSGFPFTSSNSPGGHAGCVGYYGSLAVNTIYLNFYVNSSNTTATFNGKATSGATMDNSIALFGNGTRVGGSITYKIA